jgi:4-hydroxy-2-oxoheptanedioate aldolase
MRKNHALARQRAGDITVGPLLIYGSPDIAEQAAHLGFDWVWLDWQHGQWTESTLNDALGRFLATACAPLVRVKGVEPGTINRVLDMGAMGVIVPMVQDAAQARTAVQAAYYPPMGMRSGGGVRLGLLGEGGAQEYFERANEEVLVAVMVETEAAIARVAEIMAVPGIDVVIIGSGDLMLDVKARGHDEAHHEHLVLQVVAASRQSGVPIGYPCGSREEAERRIGQGFRFINYGSDHGVLTAGFQAILEQRRGW